MKICIIGSGLTSLVLAESLSKKGIVIDLIVKNDKKAQKNLRTLGISNENLNFLKNLFPSTQKLGNRINKIEIYNDIKNKILNFENPNTTLFYMFKYDDILKSIKKKVIKNRNVKIISNLKTFQLSDRILDKYNLIIDTNLKNNFSKKHFHKKIKKNYFSSAYINIIKHDKIKNNIARQVFTDVGPLAFLPLSQNLTSIVYSVIDNKNEKINVPNLISKISSFNFGYKNIYFSKFDKFKLNLNLLKKYYYKNVLAFGDKLHTIHPLAGQGFNMSLRDIKILNNIINNNINLGLPLDTYALKEFQNSAKYKNIIFATGIDFIFEFFTIERKIPKIVTNKLFNFLDNNKISKYLSNIANKGI